MNYPLCLAVPQRSAGSFMCGERGWQESKMVRWLAGSRMSVCHLDGVLIFSGQVRGGKLK